MADRNSATFTGPIEAQQRMAASKILFYMLPELMVTRYGSQQGVPNNTGDTIKFSYFDLYPVTGVSMIEGVNPGSMPINRKNVSLVLQQYGTWTPITDWTVELHPDNIMEPILKNLATWQAQTVELVTLNALLGGTNVLYAGNVDSRLKIASTINRQMVAQVNEIFNTNSAHKITEIMSAAVGVGTSPIAASYLAICTPQMEDDVAHCVNYKPVSMYSNPKSALPNEFGSIEKVRFCTSTFLKPWAAAATTTGSQALYRSNGKDTKTGTAGIPDVHPIIFLAKEAFACATLNSTKGGKVVLRKPGNAAPSDELGQTGSAGIKFWFGATILNDFYLIRGEALCTNPSCQPS